MALLQRSKAAWNLRAAKNQASPEPRARRQPLPLERPVISLRRAAAELANAATSPASTSRRGSVAFRRSAVPRSVPPAMPRTPVAKARSARHSQPGASPTARRTRIAPPSTRASSGLRLVAVALCVWRSANDTRPPLDNGRQGVAVRRAHSQMVETTGSRESAIPSDVTAQRAIDGPPFPTSAPRGVLAPAMAVK